MLFRRDRDPADPVTFCIGTDIDQLHIRLTLQERVGFLRCQCAGIGECIVLATLPCGGEYICGLRHDDLVFPVFS